ncbi:hypothetical protein RSOL_483300 [Rhizoctonia solani AG-3 Rhs1AP]|uniref:Uncharacterized protein n=1 Tax=Rhizoctonia solani AG-3 Rhs1AP TaxID=1086054 RepID=X8JIY3_9AGAM|nr:hypothetical protein RSOL_483300 [Rhizoctonia solani AG-3 Rhs1AP]
MSTQKRKAGDGDYDSEIECISDSDSNTVSPDVVSHKQTAIKKYKATVKPNTLDSMMPIVIPINGPPHGRISGRMKPRSLSAAESSKTTDVTRGRNDIEGPITSAQPKLDVNAEFKGIRAELKEIRTVLADIQLALGGLLALVVKEEGLQLVKEGPAPLKTFRRAGALSDFHHI